MASRGRSYRDEVAVHIDSRGDIQLKIPSSYAQHYWKKKQKYIAFGAKTSGDNESLAHKARALLQEDLDSGKFDPGYLIKYKHPRKQKRKAYRTTSTGLLIELFDQYTDYNPRLSVSGRLRYKKTFRPAIASAPQDLTRPQSQLEVFQYLKTRHTGIPLRQVTRIIKNMICWALANHLLPEEAPNLFEKYSADLQEQRVAERGESKHSPAKLHRSSKKAWTKDEVAIILDTIKSRRIVSPYYKNCDVAYLLFKFLFLTGMRHGEAFGLNWSCLSGDRTEAIIKQSYSSVHKIVKETKTGKVRTIRLSPAAQEIIKELESFYQGIGWKTNGSIPVFRISNGNRFSTNGIGITWYGMACKDKFQPGVVMKLVSEGKLPQYIDAYSTRRTFVSLQAQAGVDARTVADYIGDNVETILKHYYHGREDYRPADII